MSPMLLDSDSVSEILKQKDQTVIRNALRYERLIGPISFSAVTRYEINRGYKQLGSGKQVAKFESFCSKCVVVPVTDEIWDRAADLWAYAITNGLPHNDADLLIAATALVHSRTLVTGNTNHFAWVPGLTVADWRRP